MLLTFTIIAGQFFDQLELMIDDYYDRFSLQWDYGKIIFENAVDFFVLFISTKISIEANGNLLKRFRDQS